MRPAEGAYVPTGHEEQFDPSPMGLTLPAGQLIHPSPLKCVPGEQRGVGEVLGMGEDEGSAVGGAVGNNEGRGVGMGVMVGWLVGMGLFGVGMGVGLFVDVVGNREGTGEGTGGMQSVRLS